MEWTYWSNVRFNERHLLPSCSGIYVIADANQYVWYVGQAANLKNRWAGRSHHRYPQLIRSNRKLCHIIYWKQVSVDCLDEQERYYVELFQPELNGCKVKKYLPKQPQVEREIKRLLKVINKPTLLFPLIRSIVAGKYEDNEGRDCIVILININDHEILEKSMRKRYANEIKKAWTYNRNYCGKNEQVYSPAWIAAYNWNSYKFEFLIIDWEFFTHLEENSDANLHYTRVVELLGIQVKALTNLKIFDELSLKEECIYLNSEGKKSLKSVAYINYRKNLLKCLAEMS
ncbi:GIY-YIG nuclease family protein [Scytonema sp. UIC 10036]|uniref:GIY-YIG nuclease family protein n=1 Tax=Scytonema sp. UIC 10036 TaxID=2304196 RepID=UPI001A9AA660|nr:GIY-YIG nuclease family protein [Scytonema sp. UIC 10036]